MQRIGEILAGAATQRDRDAATFYFHRAARKLRLAGLMDRDEPLRILVARIAALEEAQSNAQAEPQVSSPQPAAVKAEAPAEDSCCIS